MENIIEKIKSGLKVTYKVMKKEISLSVKDAGVMLFFIIAPIFYPLIYTFLYNNEETTDVKLVVVDECNTPDSRQFRRMVDATKEVEVVGLAANMTEAREAMREKSAYGVMRIPRDFSKKIVKGEQTCVNLYSDMTSLMYYKAMVLGITYVSLDMNADIQIKQLAEGGTGRQQELSAKPVKYEHIQLFNTQNGYGSYLIPGVLVLILQQLMVLGVGMAAGTNRDNNQGKRLVAEDDLFNGTFRNVFGKAIAYQIVWTIASVFLFIFIPWLFELPSLGKNTTILFFAVPYVMACSFFSMTMSFIVRERESAFLLFVFTSIILLFSSGISWPWTSMNMGWRMFAHLFPSTFGVQSFVSINTMGCELGDISEPITKLWIQVFFYMICTCILYKIDINKGKKLLGNN
ncbi:MAG: ABC transporter permease [Paludibacteraceae bacterium]|nr:ABC transporter permease [Paludibacteraceae bacterium]